MSNKEQVVPSIHIGKRKILRVVVVVFVSDYKGNFPETMSKGYTAVRQIVLLRG